MRKKTVAFLLALTLLLGGIGGLTIAWLTAKTEQVKNVFASSDINLTLTEETRNYKMVPGKTIAKDPKVTVLKGSVKCYVFIQVEKKNGFDDYCTYTIDTAWTSLANETGVYYQVVDASEAAAVLPILTDNQVSVKDTVTKAMMTAAAAAKPELNFQAFAIQYVNGDATNFTPAEAWAKAKTLAQP